MGKADTKDRFHHCEDIRIRDGGGAGGGGYYHRQPAAHWAAPPSSACLGARIPDDFAVAQHVIGLWMNDLVLALTALHPV